MVERISGAGGGAAEHARRTASAEGARDGAGERNVGAAPRTPPHLAEASALPSMTPPDAAQSPAILSKIQSLPKITFSLARLIQLVLELANQQHKAQRDEAMGEANAALQMGEEAAEDVKASAADMLIGGALGASMKIIGAGIQLGGAAQLSDVGDTQVVMNKMMNYQAGNQITGAIGDFGDGTMKYEAGVEESQKTIHEAQGQRLHSVEESERQDANEEQQLIQSIIQTLEKQEESRHEAVRATA